MKIGEIDYDKKLPKKSLFLCKPNKQTIAKINEAYDFQYLTKLSTVNELSFKIPTVILVDDVPNVNPNIDRIKQRYIFKFVIGGKTEYFLFNESNKVYGEDEYVEYRAFSLGVQLADRNIREFEKIGNLFEVATEALDDVYGSNFYAPIERWTIGYVDSYFTSSDAAKRKYSISSMSMLEAIYDMAEKWNAVLRWDTEKLEIEFLRAENTGLNKGFYVRDGKYLESFGLKIDSSGTVTRLRAFGSDGLTIRGINPIGQDYIEDFSFYMYPFEWNEVTGKVIQSSDHMSDSLCIAILKHQKRIADSGDAYQELNARIRALQSIATIQNETLSRLTLERILLEDERDVLLAEFNADKAEWGTGIWNESGTRVNTPAHTDILDRLAAKRAEESNQRTVVDNANLNIEDVEREKREFLEDLSPSENYTTNQWSELQPFIITKEYTNDSITSAEDLLKEAQVVFKQMQMPKLSLSIDIVDFLSVVECQNDWDKLGLGDTIRVRYDRMNVNIRAKIIEINYDFENFGISLTIANEEELKDDSLLATLLNKADTTSTIVDLDRNKWNLSLENNGRINDIINNKWDSLKNAVVAGYEQMIEISERGIIVKSLDDPSSWLVIQNGLSI